jgi:Lon protease-like protein
MFPLPDYFLFPGALVPLHIFEPRYRQMINDLLDRAGRLVMASLTSSPGEGSQGSPAVLPIGGLAEIVHHEPLEDGRFLIWIVGLGRVRIQEVPSEKPYRLVQIEVLHDLPGSAKEQSRLRPLLETAIQRRSGKEVALAEEMPIGALADILLQSLRLSPKQLQAVYAETSATRRAEQALAWSPNKP